MTSIQSVLLILLVVVIAAVLLWLWFRSHTYKQATKQAASLAREVFPVWAAQGPFQSGAESAAAMRYAYLAVKGPDEGERLAETTANHASAYDSDPATWERTRQETTRSAGPETEKFVTIAEGFAATESLNKEFLERGGHKRKLARQSVQDTLEWSSNPGAHEAHLIRRHNNPYFPESRRTVSKEELLKARIMDNDDYILCQQRFAQFLEKEIEGLPSTLTIAETIANFHKLRKHLDDLIRFSMGVGGPAKEVMQKADRIRDAVISDMRAACSNHKEALENIEKADAYNRDHVRKFNIPIIAQMRRKRSPIEKEETIATILSEEPETIAIYMNILPEDVRSEFRLVALKMMQEVSHHGHVDPQFEEKVSALEGKWPFLAIGGADFDEGLAAAQRGDYAAALREWRPLAEKDDATAQYNLGIMYENGWGVPKDPTQAVQWYREAAKSGNTRFIFHLASMYSLGKGVPTDFVRAYMFFSLAAEMGDIDGVEGRDLHAKAMTSAQITKAKILAQEWRMKHLHKK